MYVVATVKMIKQFPNQKLWMDRKVRALVRDKNVAFREPYMVARRRLRVEIREAKQKYKLGLEI